MNVEHRCTVVCGGGVVPLETRIPIFTQERAVPLGYRLLCPMCPDRLRPRTMGTRGRWGRRPSIDCPANAPSVFPRPCSIQLLYRCGEISRNPTETLPWPRRGIPFGRESQVAGLGRQRNQPVAVDRASVDVLEPAVVVTPGHHREEAADTRGKCPGAPWDPSRFEATAGVGCPAAPTCSRRAAEPHRGHREPLRAGN